MGDYKETRSSGHSRADVLVNSSQLTNALIDRQKGKSLGVSLFFQYGSTGSSFRAMICLVINSWPDHGISHGFHLVKQDLNPIRK